MSRRTRPRSWKARSSSRSDSGGAFFEREAILDPVAEKVVPRPATVLEAGDGIDLRLAAAQNPGRDFVVTLPGAVLPFAWDQPDNAARVAGLGAGLTLGSRRRSSRHISRALARLMAPDFGDRCRAIASRAGGEDGFEHAAGWVVQLAGMVRR